MTLTKTPARSRSGAATTVPLMLMAIPVALALTLYALIGTGVVGLAPLLIIAVLFLYRFAVRSTHSDRTRVAAREIGALVLCLPLGFGVWVGLLFVGAASGILPFIVDGDYPYANAWMAASTAVAMLSVAMFWSLLRRWADPASVRAAR